MNSITVRPASLPTSGTINPFLAAAHDMTTGVGKLLKFVKGQYTTHTGEIPIGTSFVAHVDQISRGWIKFIGTKLVDIRVYKVAEGRAFPTRDSLGDLDESKWEVDARTKAKRDPWVVQWYLPLSDLEGGGEMLTFVSSSTGGIGALGRLCNQYGRRVEHGERGLPVVSLASDSYSHKTFGNVLVPEFKVETWDDGVLPPPQIMAVSKACRSACQRSSRPFVQ
jgi:hypothetical protein